MVISKSTIVHVSIFIALSTTTADGTQRHFHPGTTRQHVGHDVLVTAIGAPKYNNFKTTGDSGSGIIGIGKHLDHLFTVPITLGDHVFSVNLDTGSSDLWLISDYCQKNACNGSSVTQYPVSSFNSAHIDVELLYGDSKTGTFSQGTVGFDTASIADISIVQQPFALIEDTNNLIVQFGASGIFGLGFPTASSIQGSLLETMIDSDVDIDKFVESMVSYGPLISRIAMMDHLDAPIFSLSLERDALGNVEATSALTLGRLPDAVDNSSLTWVPVRLYTAEDGGMGPPSFAPDEIYPYRWEIDIDGVFLDGERLPDTTIPASGVDSTRVSALIDTGNTLLRGPEDVVVNLLKNISPGFNPDVEGSVPTVACNVPRLLSFQIGGQMFPIDPRDFISQLDPGNAVDCQADNLVPADPPAYGSLFRWSLGTPFFKSNFVAFHYGNLTHPSMDPPRIGFLSKVPTNAGLLLQDAVRDAIQLGMNINSAHTRALHSKIRIQCPYDPSAASATLQQDTPVAANHSNAQDSNNYLPVLIHIAILLSYYI